MSDAKWSEASIPDQAGRTALVTGANSGIGFEAAVGPRDQRCAPCLIGDAGL